MFEGEELFEKEKMYRLTVSGIFLFVWLPFFYFLCYFVSFGCLKG